ncbi:PepSY domain-containing protein [Phyllobacterium sp. K27]
MKRILFTLGALSIASWAYAQETPKPAMEPETPAVATPETTNPDAPVAGENSFTEAQAKERIEAKGFTSVTGLMKGEDGIWTGMGTKDGKSFEVKLDYQGNVTETAK